MQNNPRRDGGSEFSEEEILILKEFVTELIEDFQEFYQAQPGDLLATKLESAIRRILFALARAKVTRVENEMPRQRERSVKKILKALGKGMVDGSKQPYAKELGQVFAMLYDDIRRLTPEMDEETLLREIFFSIIFPVGIFDRNTLMGKYEPLLGLTLGEGQPPSNNF